MGNARLYLIPVSACLLTLFSYVDAALSADRIVVLEQGISAVTAVSTGRFFKIAWRVKIRNETPDPQICKIKFSLLNSEERAVGRGTKSVALEGRETKTVKGTVQLRASAARQIVSSDVALEIGEKNQAKTD